MTTLSIPPKNLLILAAVGIAAYWLTSRKASAAQGTNNSASKQFFVSPATASLRQAGQGTGAAQSNLISAALNFMMPNRTVSGINGAYYPARLGTAQTANDGNAGEAEAAAYAASHPDQFVENPPSLYQQEQWRLAAIAEGNNGDY